MKVVGGDDFGAFYAFIANSKNHAQAGGFWDQIPDPAPSESFSFFATCASFHPNDPNNGNISEFCDRDIDKRFAHAEALQASDPGVARDVWSGLDREVTDVATLIPVVVPEGVDFLSKRVGNYQHNGSYGALFDQLWVT